MQIKVNEHEARLWLGMAVNFRDSTAKSEMPAFEKGVVLEKVDGLIAKLKKVAGEVKP